MSRRSTTSSTQPLLYHHEDTSIPINSETQRAQDEFTSMHNLPKTKVKVLDDEELDDALFLDTDDRRYDRLLFFRRTPFFLMLTVFLILVVANVIGT